MPTEDKDYLETESPETPQDEDYSQEDNLESDVADSEAEESEEDDDADSKLRRYKEQAKGNKEEAMRLRQMVLDAEIEKAWKDANAVLELHAKDPKLAKEVAQHYWFDSIDDVKDYIRKESWDSSIDNDDVEKRAEAIAERKIKEREHQKAIDLVSKKIGKLPEEVRDEAMTYFEEIIEGKLITPDSAKKYADMVTLYVQKDEIKKGTFNNAMAQLSSTWLSNSKKVDSSKYIVVDWKLVLDNSQSNNG